MGIAEQLPLQLSPDQARAFDAILDFANGDGHNAHVLVGHAGTGKTTLAYLAAETAQKAMWCTGYLPTTATTEWTTYETIGGLQPGADGLYFRPGLFVEAIESGLTLVNGLHQLLADDPEIGPLAASHGVSIVDVRTGSAALSATRRDDRSRSLDPCSDLAIWRRHSR